MSALIHAGVLHSYPFAAGEKNIARPEIVELVPLPREDKKTRETEHERDLKGQVVDLGPERPSDKAPSEDTRFLSERNMRTDLETVKHSMKRTGSPERPSVNKESLREPYKNSPSAGRQGGRGEDGSIKRPDKGEGLKSGTPGHGSRDYSRDDLMVSMADIKHALKADDGSIDYLPDVLKGELTALNARKYTYAAFYNRMKKVISFYWEPGSAISKINWTGATLETRLQVVINRDGGLDRVEILTSSGFPLVDAAAVRAMRKAAPFYNVPPGLLNDKGQLDDVWSFYVTSG